MKTFHPSKFYGSMVAFFMLLFHLSVFGQFGEIISIKQNGVDTDNINVVITIPLDRSSSKAYEDPKPIRIFKKTDSKKGYQVKSGSIIEVPKNTIIGIRSSKAQITIEPKTKPFRILYLLTDSYEVYRSMDEDPSGNIFVDAFGNVVGDIRTDNIDGTIDTVSEGTQWNVSYEGDSINIKVNEGRISIKARSQIEMNDDIIKFNDSTKRILYITETLDKLSQKDPEYPFNSDRLLKPPLNNEEHIDEFFKEQLLRQKHFLKSGGSHSKAGFKMLSKGRLEEGITEYEKAIEFGEMDMDGFIQASLLLTEAFHEANTKKNLANSGFRSSKINENKYVWLEVSMHFINATDSINERIHNHFIENGYPKLAKAFGYDLVLSKKYLAWAYTVKLKLYGCLETREQNPIGIMKQASKLENAVKGY